MKFSMLPVCFLLLIRSCQNPVYAAPKSKAVPLYIISVDNSYMAPKVRARAVRRAIGYFKGYGARFGKPVYERRADPFISIRENGASLFSFNQEFTSWFLTMREERKLRPGVAVHVAAPPYAINGSRYMGGFAFLSKFFSYSTAQEFNSAGAYRFRHTVVGIVHELGHSVFGCYHELGANMMNASAFAEQELIEGTGNLLPIGPECLKKIKKFKYL